MHKVLVLVMLLGCGDDLDPGADGAGDIDAAPMADALRLDGDGGGGACANASTAQPDGTAPIAGLYCADWERTDGQHDAFPRYFDRVDVALAPAALHWWASGSGGVKDYDTSAVDAACITVGTFSDGFSSSDPFPLCWASDGSASGTMTFHTPGISDTRWRVRLSRFE